MKVFDVIIPKYCLDDIFIPIRDKFRYAHVLLTTLKLILLGLENTNNTIYAKIIIDKMSRVFFYRDDKYYSISFPFNLIVDDDQIYIKTYSGRDIGSKEISEILAIINSSKMKFSPSLIDFYIDPDDEISSESISILEEVLMQEPSYIRYDYDPISENGDLHPLYHLDVHYSSYGTMKIGLKNSINNNYFENLHDINTNCSFLDP